MIFLHQILLFLHQLLILYSTSKSNISIPIIWKYHCFDGEITPLILVMTITIC